MPSLNDLYPPSPAGVSDDVVRPTFEYRLHVVAVLISLVIFVALYFGLIAGAAWWTYHSFAELSRPNPMNFNHRRGGRGGDDYAFLYIITGIASAILCLFLVKSLFKRTRLNTSLDVELHEADQPLLFAFLRRLCEETRSPFPARVFVNYQVNAAVFYHQSFLSLFLPTRKNLLIGLGLVNSLNLSEFKAVLAHEFGHFSQNSMKLGTYVYTSNRLIADLVYSRDWLDDLLDGAKHIDFRIAIFVWLFLGVLWVLRTLLEGLFTVINYANSALMRKMEFNADLVAYRVAGSDAIVHSLAKTVFADECLNAASRELFHASDHKLWTRDLFHHQTHTVAFLRKQMKDPTRGVPPPLADDPSQPTQVFKPEDHGVPLMWASHPSNYDRERNVKEYYLRVPPDERSAWVLFEDAAELKKEVTRKYYELACNMPGVELSPAEAVQAFLDAEHEETTFDDRFHGLYDEGVIGPGDLDQLVKDSTEYESPAVLAAAESSLFSESVKQRAEAFRSHRKEYATIHGLANGYVKSPTFKYQDHEYPAKKAKEFLPKIQAEIDEDQAWLTSFDRSVFLVHYAIARSLGSVERTELLDRYRFHLAVQDVHTKLNAAHNQLHNTVGLFAGQRRIEQADFQYFVTTLNQVYDQVITQLEAADKLVLPTLRNMPPGQNLGDFLWSKPYPGALPAGTQSIDGVWINSLFAVFAELIDKARRIQLKSMGGLLALQSTLANRWRGIEPAKSAPANDGIMAI